MRKILTIAGAALALSCLNAPAKAQAVFESAYTQPTEMVDGVNVGDRVSFGPRPDSASVIVAQHCRVEGNCGRPQGAR